MKDVLEIKDVQRCFFCDVTEICNSLHFIVLHAPDYFASVNPFWTTPVLHGRHDEALFLFAHFFNVYKFVFFIDMAEVY